MSANAAYTIIAVALIALIVIIGTTVWALNARDKRRSAIRKEEKEAAEREWASKLHDLARRMMTLDSVEQITAGRVLLDHAHLLRPELKQCGCPVPQAKGNSIIGKTVTS